MSTTECLMILSTLLGPIVAVQITRYLDDKNEERGRKLKIFKTLMATRAYNLSSAHVEALNSIDLEFSSKNKNEKLILDCWQEYLDHLGSNQINIDITAWNLRRVDLLVELLHAMGKNFGYDFNKTQVKNATYSPTAHGQYEAEQANLRANLLEVLEGKRDLRMRVTSFPPQL